MDVGIDDVTNRFIGYLPYRRNHLIAYRRESGVHEQYAFVAHLQGDVAPRSHQHINVALHRQYVNLRVGDVPVLNVILLTGVLLGARLTLPSMARLRKLKRSDYDGRREYGDRPKPL